MKTYFKVLNNNRYEGKIAKIQCFDFNNPETLTSK